MPIKPWISERDAWGTELTPNEWHHDISLSKFEELFKNRQNRLSPYDRELNLTNYKSRFYSGKHYLCSIYNNERFILSRNAEIQLLKTFGWNDFFFYEKLNGKMKSQLINYCISNLAQRKPERLFRFVNQNICRAILSTDYKKYDDQDILEIIKPFLLNHKDATFSYVEFFEESSHFRIVFNYKKPIDINDEVAQGIHIRNSEVGKGSVSFKAIIYRLVCKNGMSIPKEVLDEVKFSHQSNQQTITKNICNFLEKSFGSIDLAVDAFKKAKSEKFNNLDDVIGMLSDNYSAFRKHNIKIMGHVKENNRFSLVNGITEYAKSLNGDSRMALEDIAGEILFQPFKTFNDEISRWLKGHRVKNGFEHQALLFNHE